MDARMRSSSSGNSGAGGAARDAEAGSVALQGRDTQRALDRQLHFLIADYLSHSAAKLESAARVSAEMRDKGFFGEVTGWDGQQRKASLEDLRGRYHEVAPDQLRRLLEEALRARAAALESGEKAAQEVAAATATLRGGNAENAVETCTEAARLRALRNNLPSSLLQRPEDLLATRAAANAGVPSSELALPDYASSATRAARLVQLQREKRDIEAELRRTGKSLQKAGEAIPVYLAKRIKDRRGRLSRVETLIDVARRSLRDDLVARRRTATSVSDIFANAQLGDRIDQKLTGPARDLVCKRLRVMKKIYGHKAYVFCVAVDKTGRWIVTGSDDALCKLWNARTGELHVTFRAHEKMICDVAIDKTNRYLASASVDETVRLWELKTGRHIAVLRPHRKVINVVKFDPRENLLISASDDGMICIWDTERIIEEDNEQIARMRETNEDSSSAAPPARSSASSSQSAQGGRPSLASLSSASSTSSMTSQQSGPVVSANAVAAAGITTRFLSPRVPIVLPHLRHDATVEVNVMSVAPQGGLIVAGSDDGIARIWAVSRQAPEECNAVPNALTRPDLVHGEYVDGASRLVCTLRGHTDSVTLAEWSKTGDRLLTGSVLDGSVRIWYWPQRAGADATDYFSTPHQRVLSLARNTNTAYAGAQGGQPGDSFGGRRRPPNRYRLPSLDVCAWSGDDQFVIVLQSMKLRKNWDQTEYEDLAEFFDQRVLIFDSYTGELIHNIGAHRKPAFVLRAHPTDKTLFMTGGHDGQICVWDVYSGKLLRKISVASQYGPLTILDGGFTPEGSSSAAIVATDVGGRLILIGYQDTSVYAGAYPEQFFSTDYSELWRDAFGNVLDARTQVAPHLITNVPIVDSQGAEYAVQSRHVHRSADNAQAMLAERRSLIRQLERQLRNNEKTAMDKYKDRFREIDNKIEHSNREAELAPSRHAARGATRIARNGIPASGRGGGGTPSRGTGGNPPRGGGGGGGGGASGSIMGYAPAPGNSSSGLLACERAEQEMLQQQMEERARQQAAQEAADDDQADRNDRRNSSRRRGRAAAQQARTQIRQFQELESRPAPVSGPNLSSDSEGDSNDEQWDDNHAVEAADDDDDDDDAMDVLHEGGTRSRRSRRAQRSRSRRVAQRRSSRPRAARNGRHRDYVEFDDESDDMLDESEDDRFEEDDDVDDRVRSSRRARPQQRSSHGRRRTSVEEPSNVVSVLRYYDREWLRKTEARLLSDSYCPQLGDIVVYCVQGHHEYLRHFPVSEAAPWQLSWWQSTWPLVLCRLDKVDYTFPSDEHQRRMAEGEEHKVESSLELTVLAVPSRHLLQGRLPVARDELWQRSPPEIVATKQARFKVTYHAFSGAEFILLRERFESGMEQHLVANDVVHAVYEDMGGTPVVFPGRITEVGLTDPQWPGSPWETVNVRWDAEGEVEQQSAWELRKSSRVQDFQVDLVDNNQVSSALAQRLARRFENIKLESCAQPFIEPVNLQDVPMYGTLVPLPMDLLTILSRLRGKYYRHLRAIERDVRLIREDCFIYNDHRAGICAFATELEQMLLQIILDETRDQQIHQQEQQLQQQQQQQQQQQVTDDDGDDGDDDDDNDGSGIGDNNVGPNHARQRATNNRNVQGGMPHLAQLQGRHGRRRGGALAPEHGGGTISASRDIEDSALTSALRAVLRKLKRQDRHRIFAEPVDPIDVPGYDEIIKHPMDFSTVTDKLNAGAYSSPDGSETLSLAAATEGAKAFEADLTLVFDNAALFNEEDSPVHRAALNGKNLLDREMTIVGQGILEHSNWQCPRLQNVASAAANGGGSKQKTKKAARRVTVDDDDDDDDEDDEAFSEAGSDNDDDDDDDDEGDEDYGGAAPAGRQRRPANRGTKRARSNGGQSSAPRSKRRANGHARAAVDSDEGDYGFHDDDDDDDNDEDAYVPRGTRSRGR